jgi:hypothetical protein
MALREKNKLKTRADYEGNFYNRWLGAVFGPVFKLSLK